MFVSPCSFRSAQCATLIALATVAGVSRFEPRTLAHATDAAATSSARCTANRYLISLLAATRQLPTTPTPTRTVFEPIGAFALPAETVVAPPAIEDFDVPPVPVSVVRPTPRAHVFPFAVGPPRRERHVPYRTASAVACVVRFDFCLVSLDRLMGGRLVPDPGTASLPSYALRGEPKPLFRSLTCASRRLCGPLRQAGRKDFLLL